MSLKNGELHAVAMAGALALTAGLAVLTLYSTRDAEADNKPDLDKMVVIEAALAQKGTTTKQPQKPPPAVKEKTVGVSRDDKKVPVEKKPDKEPPKKTDPTAKTAPDRRPTDEEPSTGPTTTPGSADGSTEGRGSINKGHPYFARITPKTELPELASGAGEPVRCIKLNADGSIKSTIAPTRTGDDLDTLADAAMQELRQKLEANPEPVPTELLDHLTSDWTCFRFKKASAQ